MRVDAPGGSFSRSPLFFLVLCADFLLETIRTDGVADLVLTLPFLPPVKPLLPCRPLGACWRDFGLADATSW
jgi:hypothetical protein